jgi:hypothetical protein
VCQRLWSNEAPKSKGSPKNPVTLESENPVRFFPLREKANDDARSLHLIFLVWSTNIKLVH